MSKPVNICILSMLLIMTLCSFTNAGIRSNVVIDGTTVGPDFVRETGKIAPSCPQTFPFPFDTYSKCCSDKNRKSSGCSSSPGVILTGTDPPACCDDPGKSQPCSSDPLERCKMHDKGFERLVSHVILLGSAGTYDWNVEPQGRRFVNLNVWPDGLTDHVLQQRAEEYPLGSLKFIICGGGASSTAEWFTTDRCHQFSLLDNLWTNFAALLTSCRDGALKVVGGVLFSFGGRHKETAGQWGTVLDLTQYYDESTQSWKYGHALPIPWGLFGLEVLNEEEVIIVGGYTKNPIANGMSLKSVWIFNVFTGAYVEKASLGFPRTSVGTAKISLNNGANTGILVVGGQTNGLSTVYDNVDILNVEENIYVYSSAFTGGPRFLDGQMINVDGTVYVFGGRSKGPYNTPDTTQTQLWKFEGTDATPAWTMVSNSLPEVDKYDLGNAVVVKITEPH